MYGYRCSRCGAYLDPGERCTCAEEMQEQEERRKQRQAAIAEMCRPGKDGQYKFVLEYSHSKIPKLSGKR